MRKKHKKLILTECGQIPITVDLWFENTLQVQLDSGHVDVDARTKSSLSPVGKERLKSYTNVTENLGHSFHQLKLTRTRRKTKT